jgi:hypothetical protein
MNHGVSFLFLNLQISMVKLGQKGGSTQNKLFTAIFLMSFIYTSFLILCVKPSEEKIKGSY